MCLLSFTSFPPSQTVRRVDRMAYRRQIRMSLLATTTLALLTLTTSLSGQTTDRELIDELAPFLDVQVVAIANVDLKRARLSQLTELLDSTRGSVFEVAKFSKLAQRYDELSEELTQAGALDLSFLIRLGPLIPDNQLAVIRCAHEEGAEQVEKIINRAHPLNSLRQVKRRGSLVVAGARGKDWIGQIADSPSWVVRHTPAQLQVFRQALSDEPKAAIRFCFALSPEHQRALVEIAPESFAGGQDGAAASVAQFKWLSAASHLQAPHIRCTLRLSDHQSAIAISAKIRESLIAIANLEGLRQHLPDFAKWLANLRPIVEDDTIHFELPDDTSRSLSRLVFQHARRVRHRRTQSRLHEIAVALHNFHDANGRLPDIALPPKLLRTKANKGLSWRVYLLPYLDDGLQLYNQFHLDEPWDSEHNLKLARQIPAAFAMDPAVAQPGKTCVVVLSGQDIALSGHRLNEISDGTSQTIAFVETTPENAVLWTRPDNLSANHPELLKQLVAKGESGFWAGMCDASLRFVSSEISATQLRGALRANDGAKTNLSGLRYPVPSRQLSNGVGPLFSPIRTLPKFWFNELVPRAFVTGLAK